MPRIALIGDYRAEVLAHQAIPRSLELFGNLDWSWVETESLAGAHLDDFQGLWFVPGSPYRDTGAVLQAARFARESGVPTLGTCGGYQHMLMEYAANVHGLSASHAELEPGRLDAVITPLACALLETDGEVYFPEGSFLRELFGAPSAVETYHCSYGLNDDYEAQLLAGPMKVEARSGDGAVKAVRLDGHPFYMGTGYQPERTALDGRLHPLVRTFCEAVVA